ncbi:hypothetical protein ACNR9Q_02835 [Maribacter sp. X9]|uniref:hypothetical protein n=1 Tax=Maribacter sp. X9 TaxID=3402159 RepID=UPI003AF396AF
MVIKKPEIKYIGKKITYRLLRDIILDENLTEDDTIILNSKNFDDVVIEYLEYYGYSMTFPHLLLGVLIREANGETIPQNRIGILKDDEESVRIDNSNEFEYYDGEIVYRCGWCGNIVDEKGKELEGYNRERAINYIENFKTSIVKHTNGNCCPNGHE